MTANRVIATMGGISLVLGVACGVCVDLGYYGTAWACGFLAVLCFLMSGPAGELAGSE